MNSRPQQTYVGGLGRLAGWCYDHRRSVVIGWIVIVMAVIGLSRVVGSAFSDNFASGTRRRSGPSTCWLSGSRPRPATAPTSSFTPRVGQRPGQRGHHRSTGRGPAAAPERDRDPQPAGTGRSPTGVGRRAHRLRGHPVRQDDTRTSRRPQTKHLVNVAQSFAHPGFQVALGGNPISATVTAAPRLERGHRDHRRHHHHADRLRLGGRHGPADRSPPCSASASASRLVDFASHVFTVPTFGPELMAMIGLGVGIDYALFVVTRYRQGLFEGRDAREATVVASLHDLGPGRPLRRLHGGDLAARPVPARPAVHVRPGRRRASPPCSWCWPRR